MEFGHDNVRQVVEEDRLSSLPDELIHKILSSFDMKFVVQTCVLSLRWKLLWTSMPCLNFSSRHFPPSPKFTEFVTHVLSHRNHQVEVFSVKLDFDGAANEAFVTEIANYALSHNVQELTFVVSSRDLVSNYPSCLFSSQSLKHLTLIVHDVFSKWTTPDTPLDFPALTSMHLINIRLCGDVFSKCVDLKNLTLKYFKFQDGKALDIITPRLSNLILISGSSSVKVINVIAPQLENLTVIDCFELKYLNAPPGYSPLSKNEFHSLNKVTIGSMWVWSSMLCMKEYARKTITMLQQLHSARYLTLHAFVFECLSSFPDLLSQYPSPFSNLISLTIDSSNMRNAYKVELSTEARNFLLQKSPDATIILKLPEVLLHQNEQMFYYI